MKLKKRCLGSQLLDSKGCTALSYQHFFGLEPQGLPSRGPQVTGVDFRCTADARFQIATGHDRRTST